MSAAHSIAPLPTTSALPPTFIDNKRTIIIVAAIAFSILCLGAALYFYNPNHILGHHLCNLKIALPFEIVSLLTPLAIIYYWKKTENVEFDFKRKKELITDADPNKIWEGTFVPAQASDQTSYLKALQNDVGRTFSLRLDLSRNRFLKEEFQGQNQAEVEAQFEKDIGRLDFYQKGRKVRNKKNIRKAVEDCTQNDPQKTTRLKMLCSQNTLNTVVISILQPRYQSQNLLTCKEPAQLAQYSKKTSVLNEICCNLYQDQKGSLFVERSMTKEICFGEVRSRYFIPLLLRVNVETGEATVFWKVIKSHDPENDPTIEPYKLLT